MQCFLRVSAVEVKLHVGIVIMYLLQQSLHLLQCMANTVSLMSIVVNVRKLVVIWYGKFSSSNQKSLAQCIYCWMMRILIDSDCSKYICWLHNLYTIVLNFIYYIQQSAIWPLTCCNIQQYIHDTVLESHKIALQYFTI